MASDGRSTESASAPAGRTRYHRAVCSSAALPLFKVKYHVQTQRVRHSTLSWRTLPCLGPILNADKYYIDRFAHAARITDESVLCIGFSESEIEKYVVKHKPKEITVLTQWVDHPDAQVTKYPLVVGDVTKRTSFGDKSFGAILTLSLMEHLEDLEGGLTEMKRLLRPGGHLFAFFGPAWSSPYGHHLYLRGGDPRLDFSLWQLPAYLHLLCSDNEIASFVRDNGLSDDYIPWFLRMFFEHPIINRVMYDDYLRLFSEYFQLVLSEVIYNEVPSKFITLLRKELPPYRDFTSYGGGYLLKKALDS